MKLGLIFVSDESTGGFFSQQERARIRCTSPGTEFIILPIHGPAQTLETELEEALAAPYVLARVEDAVRTGCDAVVVDCALDPGVAAAREMVSVPVIGAGEAALVFASAVGQRIALIAHAECIVSAFRRRILTYGLADRVSSIQVLDENILDVGREGQAENALRSICDAIVVADEADVIVMGCTGFAPAVERVRGDVRLPLIEPALAAIQMAEAQVRLGMGSSRAVHKRRTPWLRALDVIRRSATSTTGNGARQDSMEPRNESPRSQSGGSNDDPI